MFYVNILCLWINKWISSKTCLNFTSLNAYKYSKFTKYGVQWWLFGFCLQFTDGALQIAEMDQVSVAETLETTTDIDDVEMKGESETVVLESLPEMGAGLTTLDSEKDSESISDQTSSVEESQIIEISTGAQVSIFAPAV